MSVEEQELHLRAASGDPVSAWALAEIAHLVEKANGVTRENWELREKITRLNPPLSLPSMMDPMVTT